MNTHLSRNKDVLHWEWECESLGMHILTRNDDVPHGKCASSRGMGMFLTQSANHPHHQDCDIHTVDAHSLYSVELWFWNKTHICFVCHKCFGCLIIQLSKHRTRMLIYNLLTFILWHVFFELYCLLKIWEKAQEWVAFTYKSIRSL